MRAPGRDRDEFAFRVTQGGEAMTVDTTVSMSMVRFTQTGSTTGVCP